MKRPTSLPVLFQVAALAAAAVIMSQAVAFGVIVLAPEPRPAGFSIDAAARALKGEPAETNDGRPLRRRITDRPPVGSDGDIRDPITLALTGALAEKLGGTSKVFVSIHRPEGRRAGGPRPPPGPSQGFVFFRPDIETGTRPDQAAPRVTVMREGVTEFRMQRRDGSGASTNRSVQQFTIRADRLTFAPFTASVELPDGRWAVVEPPRSLLSPWQKNMLIALAISALLLAPLVWWMARRLTRPIRVFADAAQRLGANPEADPLAPSGPREVRTAIDAFNDMQSSLRNHMRQRTQTVAAIAHDLRTPLTRLRFRAEQAPDAVRDRMVSDIEEMDALIAQAMAFVRGEATPERREPLDLDALAADCAAGFVETDAPVSFDGGGELPVMSDPAALRRALANLIGNAIQYGGVARVKAFASDGKAVVTVEDDGPGLPDEELEAVFEPFHRAERSRNRETGGAGLGLTIARQAARAHGGDVTLSRRSEGGLIARLHLPLDRG
ncbi:ATP-binding protein [Brevundimonas kwangchunensis]|uniref:histidine kinase n=1 Tax=Brevundimonas kwangchunensis TaxID=322163 RepID=A0ABN1GE16_9CAUL